jgi:hypothetical protein
MRLVSPETEPLPALATQVIDTIATNAGLTLADVVVDVDGITIQARPTD